MELGLHSLGPKLVPHLLENVILAHDTRLLRVAVAVFGVVASMRVARVVTVLRPVAVRVTSAGVMRLAVGMVAWRGASVGRMGPRAAALGAAGRARHPWLRR